MKHYVALHRAHTKLKRAARARKRDQTLSLLKGAEQAAAARDSRRLYQYVRLLSPKGASKRVNLRGAKGELLEPSRERTLLVEYARELFTGDPFDEYALLPLPEEWFSSDAWVRALRKQRSHKAAPLGSASVQAWKDNAELVAEPLSRIAVAELCSQAPTVPKRWTTAQLIWIAKPSKPPVKPENLRSLGLMASDTKAFLYLLKERASPYVQARMASRPLFAYRQGTSTYDPILRATSHCHQVRALLAQHKGDLVSKIINKQETELTGGLMCSLDLTRAFDLVDHSALYRSLLATNMPACLASVLIEVHRKTCLSIAHGGDTECFSMSRGLRQGCLVAPMLCAAWVCQFCADLDEGTEAGFSLEHVSVFADDKHLFWEIHSKSQFHKAVRQLHYAICLLEERSTQVSFLKSAVVYALRGRAAEEIVGRYTAWFRGERHFLLRSKTRTIKLPVHDRLVYLGVVLSYGAFEMQSARHRADKAAQNFGMLSKPLRMNGALSKSIRLRIYRACIWSTLSYGLIAVGFTAGSLQHVISTAARQLRKVLRMHEKGTTNKAILEAATLDVTSILLEQARGQLSRIQSREVEGCALVCRIERERVGVVLEQLETFTTQVSQGRLQAVVADQAPRVECPICGIEFAGDYGLQMHIKAKHTEINQRSPIDFVRSKHSLHGAPFCRFCHARCYNWQALEKHIAEGACPRIKDALARDITIEVLYEQVLQEEAANPPVPPSELACTTTQFLDSKHPVLTCPFHEVPTHLNAFDTLRLRCGLCGQVLREANTVKTHWRSTHPLAWEYVRVEAERAAKAMSAIFVSPCRFCGLSNKQASQHATRCPAFFQVSALRWIQSTGKDPLVLEGAKSSRPRLRVPEYKTWRASNTQIGRAFGLQQQPNTSAAVHTATTDSAHGVTTPALHREGNARDRTHHTGLHRFFSKKGEVGGGQMRDGVGAVGMADIPWTCQVQLRNPHSLCYVNACTHALLHLLYASGQEYGNLEFLHQACRSSLRHGMSLTLSTLFMFRSLLPNWQYNDVQRDAAEYAMLLLDSLRMLGSLWHLLPRGLFDDPLEQGGTPLMMSLPDNPCTLQDIIDAWQSPEPGTQRLLRQHSGQLATQLDRYNAGNKLFTEVSFEDEVSIAVCPLAGALEHQRFSVSSAIMHTGRTVHSGHYQALLRVGASWRMCDDGVCSSAVAVTEHVCKNVYVLFLKHLQ